MKLQEALDRRKQTFYHASPKRLKVGTILTPNQGNKDKDWQHHAVFLTTKPLPHFTIAKHAEKENWDVYEVEPIGKVEKGMWDDLEVDRAKVVKYIGKARGIANNHKRKTKFDKRTKNMRKHLKKSVKKDFPNEKWHDGDFKDDYPSFGSSVGRGTYRKMKKKY